MLAAAIAVAVAVGPGAAQGWGSALRAVPGPTASTAAAATADPPAAAASPTDRPAAGLIVTFDEGSDPAAAVLAAGAAQGIDLLAPVPIGFGMWSFWAGGRLLSATDAARLADAVAAAPGVASAAPDVVLSVTGDGGDVGTYQPQRTPPSIAEVDAPASSAAPAREPDTSQSGATWGIDRIDQRSGTNSYYRYDTTGAGVVAYVVDTGIRTTHQQFTGRIVGGATAIDDGLGVGDCDGHGTHVSGTIGGTVSGVAKGVSISPVRVADCRGLGTAGGVIAGLDWIVTKHVSGPAVVNISMGIDTVVPEVDTAVANVLADGVTVVVASGNAGVDACTSSPARVAGAITVNASTRDDGRPSWSNHGSCTDIYAPGVDITSAGIASDTATIVYSGTSMAAPHVSGGVARYLEGNPAALPPAVWSAMNLAATPVDPAPGLPSDAKRLLFVYTPVAAPTGLSAVPGDASAQISFTPPAEVAGPTLSNYQYSLDGGTSWAARSPASIGTPLTIIGLTNGRRYQVKLRAVSTEGVGLASAAVEVVPRTTPGAPTITGWTLGDGSVSVQFDPPASDGGAPITTYHYSTDNGTTWQVRSPSGTTSPLVITGLTNMTTYQVRLRAVNIAGWGAASYAFSMQPGLRPDAPTLQIAQPGNGSVTLYFAVPASDGGVPITNYEYSKDGGTTWVPRSPASTTSPLAIGGLTNGTAYSFTLRAINAKGAGPASAPVSATPRTTPGAPTITAISPVDKGAVVTFTPPASDGGAIITTYEYSVNDGATWAAFSPADPTSPVFITGLVNGTTYTFRLRAVNAAGAGVASNPVTAVPRGAPGGAPINLVASPGNGLALITFMAPTDTGGLALTNYEYSKDNGATWSARSPASTASPLLIGGLTNGTAYLIKLRAVNAQGSGPASTAIAVTPRTTPGAPAVVSVTPGSGSGSVAFTPPASDGGSPITTYQYSLDGGATWQNRTAGTTGSPLVITGLVNGTSYITRIRAVNAAGGGDPSNPFIVTPRTVPGAPTGLLAVNGDRQSSITFTAPSNGGSPITNYKYSLNSGGTWTDFSPPVTGTSVTITGLVNGVAYSALLRAVNVAGDGAVSSPVTLNPRGAPGGAPTGVVATPGNGSASISFTAPTDNGGVPITTYQYSTDNGATWVARSPAGTASPLQIGGLANGTTYQVKLRAVNPIGAGPESVAAPVTPRTVPGAPTTLVAYPGNGSVTITFTAGAANGAPITNYEFSTNGGAAWQARSPASAASPIALAGLANGTPYQVLLRAVNAAGAGPASAPVSFTPRTVPSAPTLGTIVAGDGVLDVTFTAPAANGGAPVMTYQYTTDGGTTWTSRSPDSTASPVRISGLTNWTTYRVGLRAVNGGGAGAASTIREATPQPVGSLFVPVPPTRALTTLTPVAQPISAGAPRTVPVDLGGVVPAGATAIAFNLTVTGQTESGFAAVTPGDTPNAWVPSASTVNWARPQQTIANAHVTKIDANRQVKVFVGGIGTAHVMLDVVGYFVPRVGAPAGAAFVPVAPVRAYSSLTSGGKLIGSGAPAAPRHVELSAVLPASATAVAYNLTITGLDSSGYLAVAPGGSPIPTTSAINWAPGPNGPISALANASVVGVDPTGGIDLYIGGRGSAHAIVDVVGYFVPLSSKAEGMSEFFPIEPNRSYDSRFDAPVGTLAGVASGVGAPRTTAADAHGAVPTGATAIAYNLTATGSTGGGYLTLGPDPAVVPGASSLNWTPATSTIANGSMVAIGPDRTVTAWAGGPNSTQYLIDVAGFYRPVEP